MHEDSERPRQDCLPVSKATSSSSCCCSSTLAAQSPRANIEPRQWQTGCVETATGPVAAVSTSLTLADRLGSWKARWGIGRMRYSVPPGLYAVGNPSDDSPVLVSANYKMSFDRLRASLAGISTWILVLDTKGINVWCAAGKGTFGTDELVQRINNASLGDVVKTRKLVLPQLGAPGVAGHEVKSRTGFRVVYGPVLASDLPAFLQSGMKATPAMRQIQFPFLERLAVVPVELVSGTKYVLAVMAVLTLFSGLARDGYRGSRVVSDGLPAAVLVLITFLAATVLGPALLPWLPGRSFSLKGVWIGFPVLVGAAIWWTPSIFTGSQWLTAAAWLLIVPATTSFLLMNFTGSTTYTSLSGVRREMRVAVPLQLTSLFVGTLLLVLGRCFIELT